MVELPTSERPVLSRPRLLALLLWVLLTPSFAQSQEPAPFLPEGEVITGYLYQNALTPESMLLATPEELEAFVRDLPPVTPYKTLPAPANPDPFRAGGRVDFERYVVAIAVGRNRIARPPLFQGLADLAEGGREVLFELPAATAEAYPFGWAVYSAVLVPRQPEPLTVRVITVPRPKSFPRAR